MATAQKAFSVHAGGNPKESEVRDVIQGVQVSAPFGNVKYALQVFDVLDEFKNRKEAVSV